MANILKTELEKADFEATPIPPKFPFRYKILHIPTASYVMEYNVYTRKTHIVLTKTEAKAGQIRDAFRLGKNTDNVIYYIEDNLEHEKRDKYFEWRMGHVLQEVRAKITEKPMEVNEFELIEEPYV